MFSKIILSILITPLFFNITNTPNYSSKHSINSIIGDVSFVDTFDRLPNQEDSEVSRITTHLNYVIGVLELTSTEHLSGSQSSNRSELISILKEYVKEERFPKNYDFEDQRRPTFIDKDGNICAVGYLVQQTVGQEAAEAINKKYKYGYLMEMESELLDNWLNEYGLTKKEAAMIQPAYGPRPGEEETITFRSLKTSYVLSSGLLMSTQIILTTNTFNKNSSLLTYTSLGLGVITLANGIYQYDQSINTSQSFFGGTIKEINVSKRNLSVANIAFGSASLIFNSYRAIRIKKERDNRYLSLTPSVTELPGVSETIPSLNLSLSF